MRLAALATLLLTLSSHAPAVELPTIPLDSFRTETPRVGFDVPATLVARDVTTDAFRAERPGERLVEIEAPVSLLLYHGAAERIDDIVVELRGADAGLSVYDYAPRTELSSDLAKPIEVTITKAIDKSVGASLGGKLAGDVALTPTVSAGAATKDTAIETRSELPPKEAVVVSGATEGRTGVYFKLRRSSQTTLEGERVFRVTFAAPADWEGGAIEVRCFARGEHRWLFVDQRRVWNETARPVELRLVSHTVAKPAIDSPSR